MDPDQSAVLWRSSWLSGFSCLYALYQNKLDWAPFSALVFFTSLNHWKDYRPGSWEQQLDMVCVSISLTHHLIVAYYTELYIPYYTLISIAACCYPVSYYYYFKNDIWTSTYYHCALHVIATIANLLLYST
jgi:hypothetical protein